MASAFQQKVCFFNRFDSLFINLLLSTTCLLVIVEQTTVKLEGKVDKYATKFEFKNQDTPVYTYIKNGETSAYDLALTNGN